MNPVEYIADVLDRVDKTADDHLDKLLPDRWKPPSASEASTLFDG